MYILSSWLDPELWREKMIITKQIQIDNYLFELSLTSKNVESHSMMSDEKLIIGKMFDDLLNKGNDFRDKLNELIRLHKKRKQL